MRKWLNRLPAAFKEHSQEVFIEEITDEIQRGNPCLRRTQRTAFMMKMQGELMKGQKMNIEEGAGMLCA
jgi:hypothetical protein